MTLNSQQRLALAICDFLNTSLADGTLAADEKDSIDVAVSCIQECFHVDASDKAALHDAVGSRSLKDIYAVYEKLKGAGPPPPAAASAASSASAPAPAPPSSSAPAPAPVSDEDKKQAEALKSKGNAAMAAKNYDSAIDLYTQALALHPGNPIFLSNRAAAHSAAKDHESAKADAEAAVAVDPTYTKAWSRLGLARFALGDPRGSMDAYKKGIDYEGSGGSEAMKKGYETAKRRVDELEADEADTARDAGGAASPNLNDLASMFGGGAGGGGRGAGGPGGGGMPDLSSVMSNPMFASMAQNLMSNPDLMQNLMSNPRLRDMANQFGGGGGMPDMSALMSDPNIADMARQMMGGGGRGRGAGTPPP